jgi:hypothetical protein
MWSVHTAFYPQHAGHLGEFWGRRLGFSAFLSSFLLLVPLFFAAIPVSMMIANCLTWLVTPARQAMEREGEADAALSFSGAMSGLWEVSKWVVPICLMLSLLGAATLGHLR